MRKRFHIERQVERLANSKTLEVIEGVLHKLVTMPSSIRSVTKEKDFYRTQAYEYEKTIHPNWECSCLYCKIQMAYTYAKLQYHKHKKDEGLANKVWDGIENLKVARYRLESLNTSPFLKLHIRDSKRFIGKIITEIKHEASEHYMNREELIRQAKILMSDVRQKSYIANSNMYIDWP